MEIKIIMLLILICIIGISGCADQENDSVSEGNEDGIDSQVPIPDAGAIFSIFTINDSYNDWSIWPGQVSHAQGSGVHGDYITIYVSDDALSLAESGGQVMPYETMVVKEGFNSDRELIGVYLMYKAEGFDPDHNDWFWASYSPDGDVQAEGKVPGCINCHERRKNIDYIFSNV
ncbi:MAG: cytochrome P460 family protein [Methanolobus sp.]|nr:cytochrome P460 family protein [Methanolobus sp.]